MKFTPLRFILSPILVLLFNASFAQESWTLASCVEYAKAHNLDIQKAGNSVKNIEVQELQSKLAFLPTANLNGGYYWNFGLTIDPISNTRQPGSRQTFSATAAGNWTLLSGGRNLFQLQQARMNRVAALYQFEEVKNNVSLNIASAYLQIIVNLQLEEVAQGQLTTSIQSLERTRLLFDNGAISKDDYLQLESDFENFEIAMPALDLDALSMSGYNSNALKNDAVSKQPSVRAAVANAESAKYGIRLAESGRYPTLFFLAQLNSNYVQGLPYFTDYYQLTTYSLVENPVTGSIEQIPQQITVPDVGSKIDYTLGNQLNDNWNQFIGLGFQIPLFNGGVTHANVQRAKIQENNAVLDLKQSELAVRQTIERAYVDATNSLALYQAANASADASNEALTNAQFNYDEGVISAFDLGLSKNQFLAAKSREIQSKFDYLFKVKVLEFYLFNQITL